MSFISLGILQIRPTDFRMCPVHVLMREGKSERSERECKHDKIKGPLCSRIQISPDYRKSSLTFLSKDFYWLSEATVPTVLISGTARV